jgi:hypothetical protein
MFAAAARPSCSSQTMMVGASKATVRPSICSAASMGTFLALAPGAW